MGIFGKDQWLVFLTRGPDSKKYSSYSVFTVQNPSTNFVLHMQQNEMVEF